MNPDEQERARRLGRAWDDMVRGLGPAEADPARLADIQFAQEVTAVPAAPADLRATIWQQLNGRSLPSTMSTVAVAPSPNGVAARRDLTPSKALASHRRDVLVAAWRIIAIGTLGGFAAGFAAGIWTRLAMRVAGFLTIDRNRGVLTENEARVGEMTLDGTLGLAVFVALIGIFGGLLYVAIRRWLPAPLVIRAVSYGGLLLAVFGFILMDENNPDYRLFGPAWLNVFTFSLTYIVFGVLASLTIEWLDTHLGHVSLRRSAPWRTRLATIVLMPFGVMGLFAISGSVLSVVGLGRLWMIAISLAMIGALPLALRSTRWSWPQHPVVSRLGLAARLVPAFFGVYLTTQGIAGILTG